MHCQAAVRETCGGTVHAAWQKAMNTSDSHWQSTLEAGVKILLTRATGYIGKRLLPRLVADGHEVICCARDRKRFTVLPDMQAKVTTVEIDLLDRGSLAAIPEGIECAYLVHSMSSSSRFDQLEYRSAVNFRERMDELEVTQVMSPFPSPGLAQEG
jgi:hypothetical protein